MSNNSIRIRTTPDNKDKFIKINLEQEFDFIEMLSLKITQDEIYRNFCSDYGVIVGRVFVNNGFGVPNAKVSVFIPIDDIDKDNPIINGLYPYEVITDRDVDGKRYNLLPQINETDNDCYTPIGSFPSKRQVLDSPEMGEVYSKYYKFTTTTNYAGDYMLFGVPVGNHIVHVDADISDIGIISQRPYDSISQGSPLQMFDSPTKFKGGNNLDKLVQLKSTNSGINVKPFWGSPENCEIGINRLDLDLNYNITPSAIFMGGLFGDSSKNSVNKNCRPRRNMGKICEQNTSEGTIEMIRKTLDGRIERFDIEGGRVIDSNGSWAYQIPMNLDYYYTNEFGELILSEDPNIGIPTRSRVRFKISMDETGGEGRLRTKANHLVPHNPEKEDDIDYEFGELTKENSFRDLYWNKIYSVSNFISRYQRRGGRRNRNFVGLKDVDDCVGDKNPAPFNRVNTVFNPLFLIICLLMKFIETIILLINSVLLTIINLLLSGWNFLFKKLCDISRISIPGLGRPFKNLLGWTCRFVVNYIPCISAKCPDEEGEGTVKVYAPGCLKCNKAICKGYQRLKEETGFPDNLIENGKIGQLSNCVAAFMARNLNLFQFDFYNDWLNGSLYYYLVKYKKRRKREKYCNHDCNRCNSAFLLDTCFKNQTEEKSSIGFREGLIKKYNNELFYAPSTKNANLKLYATELINLGSVFKCDWQGIPKIQDYLTPTSYIIPPILDEFDDENSIRETTGQVDIGSGSWGLFFDINCIGLSSNERQCLNLRHACEIGVGLDELDESDEGVPIQANNNIGSLEINSESGKFVRDVFYILNKNINDINVSLLPEPNTNFNINNNNIYNFANATDNGLEYSNFRGVSDNNSYLQPKHSFYFYFGLLAGNTGLDKLNNKFFTKCLKELELEFFIRIDNTKAVSADGVSDGEVTFTIISGTGPFTYVISGPNGYNSTGVLTEPNLTQLITGLAEGTYTINVVDDNNNSISQTFEIPSPIPLYAIANVSQDNINLTEPFNGTISLNLVGGGSGNYTATLYNSSGNQVSPNISVTEIPLDFTGLGPDNGVYYIGDFEFNGYYLVVNDDSSPQQEVIIRNLVVGGLSPLIVTTTKIQPTCFDSSDGVINVSINGGVEPYLILTYVSPITNDDLISTSRVINNLFAGDYTIQITDSSQPDSQTITLDVELLPRRPEMILNPDLVLLPKQCDPDNYEIFLNVVNGGLGFDPPIDSVPKNYTTKYGNQAYIQFNYDDAQTNDGDEIWVPATPVAYTYLPNTNNRIKVTIPKTNFLSSVKIRLTDPQGICGSDYAEDNTDFDINVLRLPPNALTVNVNGIDNSRQCTPNTVSFKFNISHFAIANYRAPYTAQFEIAGQNGNFIPVSQTQTITQNQQLVTLTVPQINGVASNQCRIRIRVTDNVGCQSPWFETPTIQLPTANLNVSWESVSVGSGNCNKTYTISGGIPPYTILFGPQLGPSGTSGFSTVPCNFTISVMVQDNAGCTKSENSN